MAQCPKCGSPATTDARFCDNCGATLAPEQQSAPTEQAQPRFCRGCGAQLPTGDRFCPKCGQDSNASAVSRAQCSRDVTDRGSRRTRKAIIVTTAALSIGLLGILVIRNLLGRMPYSPFGACISEIRWHPHVFSTSEQQHWYGCVGQGTSMNQDFSPVPLGDSSYDGPTDMDIYVIFRRSPLYFLLHPPISKNAEKIEFRVRVVDPDGRGGDTTDTFTARDWKTGWCVVRAKFYRKGKYNITAIDNDPSRENAGRDPSWMKTEDIEIKSGGFAAAAPEQSLSHQAPLANGANEHGRWPWTSSRQATIEDIASLSENDLDIMRNEIYARHGHIFKRSDLQRYFSAQSWYHANPNWKDSDLSDTERRNIEFISAHEKVHR